MAIEESRNGKPSGIQLVQVEGFLEVARRGSVSRAAEPPGSTYVLPQMLEKFVAAHPRVEVSVRTGHSEDVVELVLRDEVQIGLGRAIRHPDLELRPFHTEDLVLVCAPDHALTKRQSVAMEDVANEKLVMFDLTSSYYEITQGAFLSVGVSLRGLMELDSIEA